MARQEVVVYQCDWCEITTPGMPDAGHGKDMPKAWGYIDSSYEILCPECHARRNEAIKQAKEETPKRNT